MNANKFMRLSCYSTAAAVLVATGSAKAEELPLKQYDFVSPDATDADLAWNGSDCLCDSEGLPTLEDLEGNLAIQYRGCDCAGCRNAVRAMIAQGQLTVTQSPHI